jgi:hypothetical protein
VGVILLVLKPFNYLGHRFVPGHNYWPKGLREHRVVMKPSCGDLCGHWGRAPCEWSSAHFVDPKTREVWTSFEEFEQAPVDADTGEPLASYEGYIELHPAKVVDGIIAVIDSQEG